MSVGATDDLADAVKQLTTRYETPVLLQFVTGQTPLSPTNEEALGRVVDEQSEE